VTSRVSTIPRTDWNVSRPSLRLASASDGYATPTASAAISDKTPVDGAARSSVEAAVMAAEQRGGVILGESNANRVSGRSLA
jgi:hypothetical protein